MDPRATLAGLVVGCLVGITGMGGGSVMTPFLIVGLGVPPLTAVASGLAYTSVTTAVGGWAHLRIRTTQPRLVLLLAAGSVPASIAAVLLFTRLGLPAGDEVLKRAVGVVLMILAIALLVRGRLKAAPGPRRQRRLPKWAVSLGGAVVGVTAGLTSIGSGSLTTAFLSVGTEEEGKKIVGTVVVHTMILTLAAGAVHMALGEVNLPLTLSLLAGSIPGVLLGSRVTLRVPEPMLREALASILLILSILTFAPKPEGRVAAGEPAPIVPAALAQPVSSALAPAFARPAAPEPVTAEREIQRERPPAS